MQLDDTICYCFHITKRKIVNYLKVCEPRVASQITNCGGAGSGCGWCVPYLKQYFAEWQQGMSAEDQAITAAEYARLRGDYIRAGKGRPAPGAIPIPPDDASPAPL